MNRPSIARRREPSLSTGVVSVVLPRPVSFLALLASLAFGVACGGPATVPASPSTPAPSASPAPIAATDTASILAAPDRSSDDRALDRGRRPLELFAFAGVKPGMKVAEIGAWKGYTSELLARAVAPDGVVYAQDPADFEKETRASWDERMKRPAAAHIVRVARPYEDPLPANTPPLDAIFTVLFYHDLVWLGVDRAKMNAALFRALKPGGVLVVADHSARPHEGVKVAKSLHRIEQSVVVDEITRAGFVLAGESDILRHPEDPRDWSASDEAPPEKRGTSDRFVLRFKKP
jgi:predicted methyltransferase